MKFIAGRGLGSLLHLLQDGESERRLDERIEDSFPASDPPSFTPMPPKHRGAHAFEAVLKRSIGAR